MWKTLDLVQLVYLKSLMTLTPTEDELEKFYHTLNSSKIKPAILKITPPYSKEFIPRSTDLSLPLPISQLYDPETLELGYLHLLKKCEEVARGLVGLNIDRYIS